MFDPENQAFNRVHALLDEAFVGGLFPHQHVAIGGAVVDHNEEIEHTQHDLRAKLVAHLKYLKLRQGYNFA